MQELLLFEYRQQELQQSPSNASCENLKPKNNEFYLGLKALCFIIVSMTSNVPYPVHDKQKNNSYVGQVRQIQLIKLNPQFPHKSYSLQQMLLYRGDKRDKEMGQQNLDRLKRMNLPIKIYELITPNGKIYYDFLYSSLDKELEQTISTQSLILGPRFDREMSFTVQDIKIVEISPIKKRSLRYFCGVTMIPNNIGVGSEQGMRFAHSSSFRLIIPGPAISMPALLHSFNSGASIIKLFNANKALLPGSSYSLQIKLRENDDPSAKIRILRNIKGNLANQNGTAYNSIRLENKGTVGKEGDGAFERFERDVRFLTREDRMKSNFEASFVK